MAIDVKGKLTASNLSLMGMALILIGNSFSKVLLNIKLHEVISNVGALILVVGVLQWFFDEESRQNLINRIGSHIDAHLIQKENLTRCGLISCELDSKHIISAEYAAELIASEKLIIGIHYSDTAVARFESIIRTRESQNKTTQIIHSDANGISKPYLEKCLSVPINLSNKISQLESFVSSRFQPPTVQMTKHGRVLRYSFVASSQIIWIIFLTNTDGYEPAIPALRLSQGSPLYEFFKKDISDLGGNL
jgi:hypothetical protein